MGTTSGVYQGERVFLEVTAREPYLEAGKWWSEILVSGSRQGHRSLASCPLWILLNHADQEVADAETDTRGLFSYPIELPGPGKHRLAAQIFGTSIMAGDWASVREERTTPKVPVSLSVTLAGQRGRQQLLIRLNAEDGSPVSGFSGTIRDGGTLKVFMTDAAGTAIHRSRFKDLSRAFEVRAGNKPGLVWRGRLPGPKPTPATPTP